MRLVQPSILPFTKKSERSKRYPVVEPLDRIELHQAQREEIQDLRTRLLNLIIEAEEQRKLRRLRLVN